jgi:hypothetical protein
MGYFLREDVGKWKPMLQLRLKFADKLSGLWIVYPLEIDTAFIHLG